MIDALDAHTIALRLADKYGRPPPPIATKSSNKVAATLRFCPLPNLPVDVGARYNPRPFPVDERRRRFLETYHNMPEDTTDLTDIRRVPSSLTSVASWSNGDDVTNEQHVHLATDVVVSVSSLKVGCLLVEVARNTVGLPPKKCTRLVRHMCHDDQVAREWLNCFGF